MAQTHPTALVDPTVQLADGVEIGPYCIVTGPVRIGPGTRLIAHAIVTGPAVIGAHNAIHPFTTLGAAPQDRRHPPTPGSSPGSFPESSPESSLDNPGIRIGDHNVIREGVSIHRATGNAPTTLGDHNYLMANAHLGHDAVVGDHCTLANGVLLGGHVHIADRVTLGGNAAVHQFCRLGRLSMLSGVVAVTQDLPPFCTAYEMRSVSSLNIVGLRRAGLRQHIRPLGKAFDIFFRSRHSNAVAIARIENELGDDPLCMEFAGFIRTAARGVTSYHALTEAPAPTPPTTTAATTTATP